MTWHQNAGAAIKRAREACGIDQSSLAIRANVTQSTVSNVERGRGTTVTSFLRIVVTLEALSTGSDLPSDLREWLTDCANAWTVPTEGASS